MLTSAATFPRRPDHAATVGRALLAAAEGLGARRVAERVDRPHTTVRGWLRRARVNAELVQQHAVRWICELDHADDLRVRVTEPLPALVDALGRAMAAYHRRFGPADEPWSVAVVLGGAALFARPRQVEQLRHPLDRM